MEESECAYNKVYDLEYTLKYKAAKETLTDDEEDIIADLMTYINDAMIALECFAERLGEVK